MDAFRQQNKVSAYRRETHLLVPFDTDATRPTVSADFAACLLALSLYVADSRCSCTRVYTAIPLTHEMQATHTSKFYGILARSGIE